jgi:ZIP family zinc transporter
MIFSAEGLLMAWFMGLSPVMQGFLATLFTYFVTMLGAGMVFFFKSVNQKVLDMMMGFAAGVMIAASFWSLLAPAIDLSSDLGGNAWLTAGMGFMLGGVFIVGSDIFLRKVSAFRSGGVVYKRSILLMSAVTLHNIPEGLAVGIAFGSAALGLEGASVHAAALLALGVGMQNFPEGVCVAMPLRRDGLTRRKSFLIGQASGIVEPIAGILGVLFALTMRNALPLALSFSAGTMIAVVCSELIPESFRENKVIATFGVLSGFAVMMVLDVALG